MLPDLTFLIVVLAGGGVGAALFALAREIRGVVPDPTRPPTLVDRFTRAARSPAFTGRIAGAVVVAVFVIAATRWAAAAIGLGLLVALWPTLFGGNRAEQRQIDELEGLVVWTESLRDTIVAHASLEQAIPATAVHAPITIRPALIRLVGQMRARVPLDKALLELSRELDDPSADLVIAALILNVRRRGDRLAGVLTGLAAAAREELEMRRKINAGRQALRRDVVIVVALTLGFAVGLTVFSPAYMAPYNSYPGQIAMAVVIGIFATGFAWMRRLSATDPVAPFLSRGDPGTDSADAHLVSALTGTPTTNAHRTDRSGPTGRNGAIR